MLESTLKDNTKITKKGVHRKSIERVWNLVANLEKTLTPSDISRQLNLQISTVKSCIEFLKNFDKVEVITNGKVMLIRRKGEMQNAVID